MMSSYTFHFVMRSDEHEFKDQLKTDYYHLFTHIIAICIMLLNQQ